MANYITRCLLEVNGTSVSDFKSFTEKARVARKSVPLMYRTGVAELTQRYQVEVDYVVPRDSTEFNFAAVAGGTLSIEYDSGTRIDFGGVNMLDVGDATIDGENELIKKITFMCETRNGNSGASITE